LIAVLAVAFLATGCGAVGRVTSGDTSKGKQLFNEKCASCHTLADAKAQGTVGPNLDDAFSSDKQQGFSEQTMADIVRGQIAYADPEGPMTPNLVRGSDADSVALYIAKCAGNPNCGVTAATAVARRRRRRMGRRSSRRTAPAATRSRPRARREPSARTSMGSSPPRRSSSVR
jgi:mono/diheme cytochrome c family protein